MIRSCQLVATFAVALGFGLSTPVRADTLPVPEVVRVPTTFSWHGTAARPGTSDAGQPHFITQGEAPLPIQTIEQRSAAIATVTRERYAAAMAINRARGEGVRVTLRSARY